MDYQIRIAYSVAEVGKESWNRLSGNLPFSSYRWYKFGEQVLADSQPFYIILSYRGQDIARGTFWLVNNEPIPIKCKPLRFVIESLLKHWPILACRTPIADYSGLILPPAPLTQSAFNAIFVTAKEILEKYRASFLVFDYLNKEAVEISNTFNELTAIQLSDPGTQLIFRQSSFDEYLASLSKSVRKDYRRHSNLANRNGIIINSHKSVPNIDEALPLINAVELKHCSTPKPWAKSLLINASMVDSTWLTAEIEGQLAGCGLLLCDGDFQMATSLGLDYRYQNVYFQLVYSLIKQSISNHIQALRGGSGAYQLKKRLGFEVVNNNYVLFTGRGQLQKLGNRIVSSKII